MCKKQNLVTVCWWSWVQQMLNGSADQQPTSASLMKAGALLDLQNTVVIYTVEDALACAKNKTLHEVSDCLLSSLWSWVNGSADQQPTSASLMKAGALLDLQNTVVIYTVEDALACAKNKTLHEVSDCLRSSLWFCYFNYVGTITISLLLQHVIPVHMGFMKEV